jgi:hypothetical protein
MLLVVLQTGKAKELSATLRTQPSVNADKIIIRVKISIYEAPNRCALIYRENN